MHKTSLRMLNRLARSMLTVIGLTLATLSEAQVPVQGSFQSNSAEPGWIGAGSMYLTSGSQDKPGEGWLRLTEATVGSRSTILNNNRFSASQGLRLRFQFSIWGGGEPAGDGMSLFLFDAAADMRNSAGGGALGYCKGAGSWLGLGLDIYGNFAAPSADCQGGPGLSPHSVIIRGPAGTGNAFIGGVTMVKGLLSDSAAKERPAPREMQLDLIPKTAGPGFLIDVSFKDLRTGQYIPIIKALDFPFAAPAQLRLGLAATSGGAKNIHEIRNVSLTALTQPSSLDLSQNFEPNTITMKGRSTLTFRFKPTTSTAASLLQASTLRLAPGLMVAKPVILEGTCPGTVSVDPSGTALELAKGFVIRPMGCTVGVQVVPTRPGTIENIVPPGLLKVESGSNGQASSASLIVRP
jgi:hypothetical protein